MIGRDQVARPHTKRYRLTHIVLCQFPACE